MQNTRPNLLFVFADQWRRQALGFMGEDPVITPNMDKFAKEGLVFENAVSSNPLCSPCRAALLTGKYPLSTGVFTNCKPGCEVMLSPDEICISDVLKQNGYATGYIGKWHLDLAELNTSENPPSGAKGWDAYTPPGPKRHGFDFWYSYGTHDMHFEPHYWMDSDKMLKVDKWSVEHETDVAIDYLQNHDRNKPFALFLSWNPPHTPYDQVPERYKDLYAGADVKLRPNVNAETLMAHTGEMLGGGREHLEGCLRNYYAAVTGLDDNFGRLMEELKKQGLEENTIIVLTSDHGDMLGSHGLMAKHVWYEESIGIPFILKWKNHGRTGREKALINSPDIMPTLLGLMELEIPASVEGCDLSDAFKGKSEAHISSAFIGACPGREVFLQEFKRLGVNPQSYGWRGIRTVDYTYILDKCYLPGEKMRRILYNNSRDPYQMNAEVFIDKPAAGIAMELEKELMEWLTKLKDPFLL